MEQLPTGEACDDTVTVPEPAHIRADYASTIQDESDSDDEREATEMRPLGYVVKATLAPISHILSPGRPHLHWYDPFRRFWRHHIRISVPHEDCRDHLANERTFLGYLRTSITLSMMGIVIAQLYRLQHSPVRLIRLDPSKVFGYYVLSKPLSGLFQGAALCMVLIGGIRFWRQQQAMAIGKVHAGGWEIFTVAVGSFSLLFMMFVVLVSLDVYKDLHPKNEENTYDMSGFGLRHMIDRRISVSS